MNTGHRFIQDGCNNQSAIVNDIIDVS